jgi:hypothetical protein
MIKRKLKRCSNCKLDKYLFSGGMCLACYNITNPPSISRNTTPINKTSDSFKVRTKKYMKLRAEYLDKFPICQLENCCNPATEIHHKRGRDGDNLFKFFLAVCREHHRYIEENPEWAKLNGYTQSRLTKENEDDRRS